MKRLITIVLLAPILFISILTAADAHGLQPAYLELSEQTTGELSVLWKRPLVTGRPMQITPQLPSRCKNLTKPVAQPLTTAAIERWIVNCGTDGLVGGTIIIDGLSATSTDTLLRIDLSNGSTHTAVLRPDSPSYIVPAQASTSEIVSSYSLMGIEHILGGIDHLLFVLGLLLIVRGVPLLIKTITAFTVAHSVTLAMATLGFVHVPQPPVEAVIALSILFLATELIKQQRGETGLTAKSPWLVALCFGLLHGFGFAGALTEVGLPQTDIPLALLFFNVGVEVGQLLFIAGALLTIWMIQKITFKRPVWLEQMPAYVIGSMASFWFIERTVSFW